MAFPRPLIAAFAAPRNNSGTAFNNPVSRNARARARPGITR
jgi:hypothetical protein